MTAMLEKVLEMLATSVVGGLGGALLYEVCRGRRSGSPRPLRDRIVSRRGSRATAEEDPAAVFRGVVGYMHATGVEEAEIDEEARDMMRRLGYEERYVQGEGVAWGPSAPNSTGRKHA